MRQPFARRRWSWLLEAANTHRELISVHDQSFTRVLPHLRPCSVEVGWVVRDIQKDAEKCQVDVHSAYTCRTGSRIRWHPYSVCLALFARSR